jgi:hypothetical protein
MFNVLPFKVPIYTSTLGLILFLVNPLSEFLTSFHSLSNPPSQSINHADLPTHLANNSSRHYCGDLSTFLHRIFARLNPHPPLHSPRSYVSLILLMVSFHNPAAWFSVNTLQGCFCAPGAEWSEPFEACIKPLHLSPHNFRGFFILKFLLHNGSLWTPSTRVSHFCCSMSPSLQLSSSI